ncbi:secreted RxLR effector protein 161-like [Osmia bicornis bicornis]|uniref:secreted RxLR effector protein 161-like n=1 Tax=Osmia bicornis bicornis TaxID=1437191 RepID=UPI001EAEFE2A|nr:secreted RxLR effector protein 161-like [Osmia bicornis bicornis]
MKDLGNVKDILGMRVERQGDIGNIKITHKYYIEKLLERFGMRECNPTGTPLESNASAIIQETQLEEKENERIDEPYRELVGCLIYLANASRPDIAFAANLLSRFCNNPKQTHWKMAKRVLRYLKGTIDYGINYVKEKDSLVAYTDFDWGGNTIDRRSNTGYLVYLAGGPVSWNSKKQKTVALSTMEAEYMALTEVTKEIIKLF